MTEHNSRTSRILSLSRSLFNGENNSFDESETMVTNSSNDIQDNSYSSSYGDLTCSNGYIEVDPINLRSNSSKCEIVHIPANKYITRNFNENEFGDTLNESDLDDDIKDPDYIVDENSDESVLYGGNNNLPFSNKKLANVEIVRTERLMNKKIQIISDINIFPNSVKKSSEAQLGSLVICSESLEDGKLKLNKCLEDNKKGSIDGQNNTSRKRSLEADLTPDVDKNMLKLEKSENGQKKHFCKYCKTMQTKFARHLENKHRTENEVKLFLSLPKRNADRLHMISKLRKEGDSLYNRYAHYNKGDLIVVRRPQISKNRSPGHYIPCGKCNAMYSILSLRAHYKNCEKGRHKYGKDVLTASRTKSFVNIKANKIMRTKILPPMRNNDINEIVRTDDLIISFGNRLTQKYRSPHLFKMIRSRLRCLARFYWFIKKRQPHIDKLEEIFDPGYYDEVILSINEMAGLDENTGHYRAPATAACIGTYLKKLSLCLVSEMIKQKNKQKLQEVRDFLQLLEDGLTYDVLKTVNENQLELKRNKNILLPSTDDISCLRSYLDRLIKHNFQELSDRFSKKSWTDLGSAILVSLQLFNRRRVGEIERVKIQDFLKYENVEQNNEMVPTKIPNNDHYVRFLIRGKRGRGVPVLVNNYNLICLKTFLRLRKEAGVPSTNPYLFGIEGRHNMQHLEAGKLLFKYAHACGARYPERLKGTELRKHFATKCSTMELEDVQLKDIADYMGHHEKIHLDHYRMPVIERDKRMSKLLEKAQGVENGETLKFQITEGSCSTQFPSEEHRESLLFNNSSSGRSFSTPKFKNERKSWMPDEKKDVAKLAEFYLENFESPTIKFCSSMIEKCSSLKKRTPNTLKAYIMNEIKKRKCQILNPKAEKCKRGVKKYWSNEEKEIVLQVFRENIGKKILPSLVTCRHAITEHVVLNKRTPEMIKAFIYNCIKKSKI